MKDKKPTSDPYVNPRFIIQKGLAVPELRDEIYCQICKQITNNTSANAERGWELMSYCVTSFSPSDKFLNHLASFILSSPKEHQNIAAYCLRSLRRTVQNTHRKLVPSTEEFEAISVIFFCQFQKQIKSYIQKNLNRNSDLLLPEFDLWMDKKKHFTLTHLLRQEKCLMLL